MKNSTEVKLKSDKGAVKVCEILEKGKNLRHLIWGILICITVVMPLAWGVGMWIAHH